MAATEAGVPATETAGETTALRDRLVSSLPGDQVLGWLGPLLVTAFGAYLRFNRLAVPRTLIFDETVRDYRPPSSRSGQLPAVLHGLDAAVPARRTDLGKPFERFREHVSRRGLVAVISDFYCDPDQMLASVQPLAFQGQDVVLMQVLDPFELQPKLSDATLFEDMETGEAIEVSPDFMQREYPERVRAHVAALTRFVLTAVGSPQPMPWTSSDGAATVRR